ncbi:7 transmembrane receptor [Necator americanus]|uniref:7 transmembrane receptor n=1 Tax=Necator americanus TaxID=51031 RepID=W2T6X2_NECAM|nr:7 transmembrane receptor [Necator americanus]ETN76906.1 7 transmembrane receptor [Necator americanus]
MPNCTRIQDRSFEAIDLTAVRAIFAVLYCLVWVAAIVGNVLVLYVVSFNQVSLSVRSVFIGCLAVSDLLMSLTSLPWTAVTLFTREWIFPKPICKLIGVFQGGSIFVSSFTLTIIALDRCLLITRPNRELNFRPDTESGLISPSRRLYGLSVLLSQFGIPALISSVCYWLISRVMSSQLERRRGQTLLKESEEKLVNRKARANRMMIAMVLGFIFAWMPLNAINLYRDLGSSVGSPWFSTVFALCHVLAMTSAALNPVIYSWFNPQFRSAIQSLCRGQRKSMKRKLHTEVHTKLTEATTDVKIKPELVLSDCHQPGDQIL